MFIGPYEHHSNELPWRHSLADVVVIDDDEDGRIDLRQAGGGPARHYATRPYQDRELLRGLERQRHRVGRARGVGAAPPPRRARVLGLRGRRAPRRRRDEPRGRRRRPDGHLAYKDAVFLSPHKLAGGPGSPGVLVVKKRLVKNSVPTQPGGGTVALVTPGVDQLPERRGAPRGGRARPRSSNRSAPGWPSSSRRAVGTDTIAEMERGFIQRAIAAWQQNPNMRLIGNLGAERLSIVSFMVRYGHHYLHNNFVVTLLNDLFGIQARGGCSCAGPYMHRLLGVGPELSRDYVVHGRRRLPVDEAGLGARRTSTTSSRTPSSVTSSRRSIWSANTVTCCSPTTSWIWRRGSGATSRDSRTCRCASADLRYASGKLEFPSRHVRLPESVLDEQLEAARGILEQARQAPRARRPWRHAAARGALRAAALVRDARGGRARPAPGGTDERLVTPARAKMSGPAAFTAAGAQ